MRVLWIVVAASFALSTLMGLLVELFLDQRVALLGGFLGLERSTNPGVAFGMHLPPVVQETLIGIALLIVLWMAIHTIRTTSPYAPHPTPYPLAFGLIIGGGIANILDRLRDGLVTDFLQVGSFPLFNVADSCITVGVALLLVEVLMPRRKGSVGERSRK